MSLTQIDYLAIFAFATAWYFQPFQRSGTFDDYDETTGWIPGAPPRWLFGPAWFILYGMLAAATFIFWKDGVKADEYATSMSLILSNWVLNKLWFVANTFSSKAAFAIIVGVLATAITTLIFFGITEIWWSFGLWIVYCLWLAYATYLSAAQAFFQPSPPVPI